MKKVCILFLCIIIAANSITAAAASPTDVMAAVENTAAYIQKAVPNPQVGSIGGEWAVLGLARSGQPVDAGYYQAYESALEAYVKSCGGVLSQNKYTEYSRVILALTAIGKDPANVAGYNLLTPLGDYDKTTWQGINGPIFALLALDSGNYAMPVNSSATKQATRQMYVDKILSLQLENGGFALSGTSADVDVTALALQALSRYTDNTAVIVAVNKALSYLSAMQNSTGGYTGNNSTNSESISQVIVALGELGVSLDDSLFVKNGHSLMDKLLTYSVKSGGFQHLPDDDSANEMATEQAFYALVSANRNISGENSLYDMRDVISAPDSGRAEGRGLSGKNADVKVPEVTVKGKIFGDISGENDGNKNAIEELVSRGIINGYEDGTFRPNDTMTRAEFAAIVVRALGLQPEANDIFGDIQASSWYAGYVGTANTYGIVNGVSDTAFQPGSTITRQEAAVMVARAAKLCGMNTSMSESEIRNVLAQFDDYMEVAGWAQTSMAVCYHENILDSSALKIQPATAVTRSDIAEMLFYMLGQANLL